MGSLNKFYFGDFSKNYSLVFNQVTFLSYKQLKYLMLKTKIEDFCFLFQSQQFNDLLSANKKGYSKLIIKFTNIFDLFSLVSMILIAFEGQQKHMFDNLSFSGIRVNLSCNLLGAVFENTFISKVNMLALMNTKVNQNFSIDYEIRLKLIHIYLVLNTVENDIFSGIL